MRHISFVIASLLAVFPGVSPAQVVSVNAGTDYLAVVGDCSLGGIGNGADSCVNATVGIPLNYYATGSQFTNLSGIVAGLSTQIAAMNEQLRQTSAFATAMGAMQDAIPAP